MLVRNTLASLEIRIKFKSSYDEKDGMIYLVIPLVSMFGGAIVERGLDHFINRLLIMLPLISRKPS